MLTEIEKMILYRFIVKYECYNPQGCGGYVYFVASITSQILYAHKMITKSYKNILLGIL